MKDRINQVKLKNLKYEIKGDDSDKCANECMDAIFLGFYIAVFAYIGLLYLIKDYVV